MLQIEIGLSPIEEILAAICSRWKIEIGANREGGVLARQRPSDVRVVAVGESISPDIVVFRFETLNERDVVGKINGFVNVIAVWCGGYEERSSIVGAAELELVLTLK